MKEQIPEFSLNCPRLYRDGKTAVVISPRFGAGWSSWNEPFHHLFAFHRDIAQAVQDGGDVESVVTELMLANGASADYICLLGIRELEVEWVPTGSDFYIHEYDGSERIVTNDDRAWFTA